MLWRIRTHMCSLGCLFKYNIMVQKFDKYALFRSRIKAQPLESTILCVLQRGCLIFDCIRLLFVGLNGQQLINSGLSISSRYLIHSLKGTRGICFVLTVSA